MALSIPTRKGVTDALRNYFRAEMPEVDPSTERRSLIGALVKSVGSALADLYITFKRWADREPFPQTASEAGTLFNGWWVALTKLERNPASPAHGYVVFTGTSGSIVPIDLTVTAGSVSYKTKASATIVSQPLAAASLVVSGSRCVFTTDNPHNLATGVTAAISGASPSSYNGSYVIRAESEHAFSYEPNTLPGSSATGSPIATTLSVSVEVQATTNGKATNLDSGSLLSVSSTPSGVEGTAFVAYGGLEGGAELESADSYRARVIKALGTDYGMFTGDEIEIIAKQIPGVTRVFIRRASIDPPSGWPAEGQVKIAFLRDNDANIFPSSQAIADVKARILALAMPAHTASEDVNVMSPIPFGVDIALSSITPDTPSMRRSITAHMQQFFRESAAWGEPIELIAIKCALRDVVDLDTRVRLKTFTLTTPSADVDPGVDGMAYLNSISFPS